MSDRAAIHSANFFKGTIRDPEASTVPSAAEVEALAVVKTCIEAQAHPIGGTLSTVQLDRALSVAQRRIRALPPDQLRNIASNSGLLKSIIDESLAVAPIADARYPLGFALTAQGKEAGSSELSASAFGRRGIESNGGGRSNYASLSGVSGQLTESERRNLDALQPFAKLHGLDWMPPRDMLAIGREGLKAIAETNLKQTGYVALRQGALYGAKDVVAFAKHAKLRGFDAENAAIATGDLVQAQPPGQRKALSDVLKAYDSAIVDANAHPNDAAARQRLQEAGERQKAALQAIAAQSADQAERVQRFEESKKIEQQFRATTQAEVKSGVKVAKADAGEAEIAALNDAPTAPPTANAKAGPTAAATKPEPSANKAPAEAPKTTTPAKTAGAKP